MVEQKAENLIFSPPKEWLSTGNTYLIIGSTGLIGSSLARKIAGRDEAFGLSRGILDSQANTIPNLKADATNKESLKGIIAQVRPNIIIDLAGSTSLEKCQENPEKAYDQNVGKTKALMNAINELNMDPKPAVLLGSTDYRYGSNGPFTEESPRRPIHNQNGIVCDYAQSKNAAERFFIRLATQYQIPWGIAIYAFPYDQTYRIKTGTPPYMFETLARGESVTGVTNMNMNPTPAEYIPHAINVLVRSRFWEEPKPLFNIAGPAIYNGIQIAKICQRELISRGIEVRNGQIKADTVEHFFKSRAPRPINGGVDTTKIQKMGIVIPDLKDIVKTFTLPKDLAGSF